MWKFVSRVGAIAVDSWCFVYFTWSLCLIRVTSYCAEKFKSDLMKIGMTTLSSKILSQDKEHFAKLAVDAVLRLKVICST